MRQKPHLLLGTYGHGSSRLCVECATKLQCENNVPMKLDSFVDWYLANKIGSEESRIIKSLELRIRELESRLDARNHGQ